MKPTTKYIIEECHMKHIDFMGYEFSRRSASYHHLIIPRRLGGKETLDNGAVLNGYTSHPYLHIIEMLDEEIFLRITSEMIDENIKRKIDIANLKRIRGLLLYFEKDNVHERSKKGKLLVKSEFLVRPRL